jgi:hypothetical protein
MLKCEAQIATVSNVNIRSENHGDDHVTGCDINVVFDTSAKVLDTFAKGLRNAMYSDDEKSGQQRVPGTGAGDEGPHLRFNGALGPLAIKKEWPGYKVAIAWGDIASSVKIDLSDVKVCKIKAEPKDGGTCGVALQLQCHPKKEDYGDLALLLQKQIELTLTPPSASELKKLQKEAEKKKDAGSDGDPGRGGDGKDGPQTAGQRAESFFGRKDQ